MIASRKCLPGQRYSISLMPMRETSNKYLGGLGLASPLGLFLLALANGPAWALEKGSSSVEPSEILAGVRTFFAQTAGADGSFRPGIDPAYQGMSDSAYSDLAPV